MAVYINLKPFLNNNDFNDVMTEALDILGAELDDVLIMNEETAEELGIVEPWEPLFVDKNYWYKRHRVFFDNTKDFGQVELR